MYLTQALHRNRQQQLNAPSTIFGERTRTHGETYDRVARAAGALRGLGIGTDDTVAILSLNSDYYYEILYAVSWADAVFVPVNIRWSIAEIAYSLDETGVEVLFVDDTYAAVAAELLAACASLRTIVYFGAGEVPEGISLDYNRLVEDTAPIEDAHRRGDQLAGLFYTGGTTGSPKGVMLSHRNLMTSAIGSSTEQWLPYRGRLMHAAPMFHLADLASVIAQTSLGGSHVIVPMFDPSAVLATIVKHQVQAALLVPTMLQWLVDDPHVAEHDLSSVTHIIYGASPMPEALLGRIRRTFPNAIFTQAYGMTEVSPVATLLNHAAHDDPIRRRSAGIAATHSLVKIVDPMDVEMPRGEPGEIVVGGDHVMMGYWKKPMETAEALRGGWMHTGDGGYMDEHGYVFLTDRLKDMIITGGENVYSIEVENVIAKHPAVATCAVVGRPDETFGERVHAVVVLAPGQSLTLDQLREHCRSELATYKCPRSLELRAEMPMSGAGKILKRELRKPPDEAGS